MSTFGTREVAASGVMAALVCVTTMLITIPIPATQGFFNIGDAMIMVAALTFGPIVGGIAGGIGSSLADILGGWYNYAPFTLIIKGIEGVLTGYIIARSKKQNLLVLILAWVVGGLEMVAGYFTAQAFALGYGIAGASVEAPFNFVQMAVGGLVGIPVSLTLKTRIHIQRTPEPVKR